MKFNRRSFATPNSPSQGHAFRFLTDWLLRLFTLNLFFLLIMGAFRLFSLLYYGPEDLITTHSGELINAFILGARFDWSILAYFASIPFLAVIIRSLFNLTKNTSIFSKAIRLYCVASFFLISLILAADTGYYSYFQDHLNILLFGFFDDDTWALIKIFWKNYPLIWISVSTILFIFLLSKMVQFILPAEDTAKSTQFTVNMSHPKYYMTIFAVSAFILISLSARGSLGLFPLGQTDAVISTHPFINHLAFNGVHALFRAVKIRRAQAKTWDANLKIFGYENGPQAVADFFNLPANEVSQARALELLQKRTKSAQLINLPEKPHVILLMMESLGSAYLKYESEQFSLLGKFKEHAKQDIFMTEMLPSHQGTIGSISSVMVNFPQRPLGAFLTESKYLNTSFKSSPARIYKSQGYTTRFVYGGNTGWRDIHKFARFQGFDHIDGDVEISRELGGLKERHDWGVYDEDVFSYISKQLEKAQTPQMIVVLTTTNHPPYEIPASYKADRLNPPAALQSELTTDKKLVESRFKVFRYACDQLGHFLTRTKNSPLRNKVVIAATGDHSFMLTQYDEKELLDKWKVPFYLYFPGVEEGPKPNLLFASHMDIFPTLYNLSIPNTDYIGLGQDLLQTPVEQQFGLHASFLAVNVTGAVQLHEKAPSQYYHWDKERKNLNLTRASPELLALEKKYKSAMGLTDFYFEEQFKNKN